MDSKFIVNLQGKEFVLFEGLLAKFHSNGGKTIDTEEVSSSTATDARFKAIVSGEAGTYSGHGDANDKNVGAMVAKHKYRMAETRAIARALRWYNNIGMCSKDELGGEENSQPVEKRQFNSPATGAVNKLNNYKKDEPEKLWITQELFEDAIKKSFDAGVIKIGDDPKSVMKILRMKYAVAKKWEDMVTSELDKQLIAGVK